MSEVKIGISARFLKHSPSFYGTSQRHIQYLETSVANWVAKNRGLPFMIPSESDTTDMKQDRLDVSSYAREMDALILQGGVDIHPSMYGQEASAVSGYEYDLVRDQYELRLIDAFVKAEKPVFGICRGFQILNVYFGGTLHQDLETKKFSKHLDRQSEEKFTHEVRIVEDGIFSRIYKKNGQVVSIHHQGIDILGKNLIPEAYSTHDGLIEAFSFAETTLVLGVQWHPEFHTDKQQDQLDARGLFHFFLEAVKNRKHFGDVRVRPKRRVHFSNSSSLTLGTELELQLLDSSTFKLKPVAVEFLEKTKNETSKIKCEIFQSMLELETDICTNAHETEKDLLASAEILNKYAPSMDVVVGSTGIHPFELYRDRILFPSSRYEKLVQSRQWIARRIAIFGLHCHVGASSADQGIELYRFYYSMAPIFLAISSSSPYYQSDPTGLHSVRSTFFESTPAGGYPPLLENWKQFEGLITKMLNSGAILSHKDLWWDLRPSPNYGTIEIRICDSMPSILENVAMVALIHLFGYVYLNSRNELLKWPIVSDWSYRENKWRAIRYGVDFDMIIDEQGNSIPMIDFLLLTLESLTAQIQELGYERYMETILDIVKKGTASDRMMKIHEKDGDLLAVVKHYVDEFRANSPIWV